jgi:predicted ATP-grasp superfamily ATP-dependent carboligase
VARILILDGHSAAALAITRSAGRAGHWVAVGANRGLFAPAKLSRYCQAKFDHPVSTDDARAFLDSVLGFVRSNHIDLVIPVTDWTIGPLSTHREQFTGLCRITLPPKAAIETASDKYATIQRAESLGIDVPPTYLIKSESDLSKCQQIRMPAVVKDRYSVRWVGNRATFGSVSYAFRSTELENRVQERLREAGDVLIQEFISGVGIGFSCFVVAGKVYLPFQWQRIREVDPRGSGSSARKSIPLDSGTVSISSRLVVEIGFEGVVMVEYKRSDDGRMVLMEINGRPWGSIGLPIAAGIDYPRYLIDWSLHGTIPTQAIRYKENIVCRRMVGELTHLSNLRSGRPAGWPVPYPSFWRSLFSVAVPWLPGMCYDDVWLSDPRPGIAGITNWIGSRVRPKRQG